MEDDERFEIYKNIENTFLKHILHKIILNREFSNPLQV